MYPCAGATTRDAMSAAAPRSATPQCGPGAMLMRRRAALRPGPVPPPPAPAHNITVRFYSDPCSSSSVSFTGAGSALINASPQNLLQSDSE